MIDEDIKAIQLQLKDIDVLLQTVLRNVNSLNHFSTTLKEQKSHIGEIRKDLGLIEERQNILNGQLGQALNTLITQSKTPQIIQLGLFAMILIMFCIHVLGWRIRGSYGGIGFESHERIETQPKIKTRANTDTGGGLEKQTL